LTPKRILLTTDDFGMSHAVNSGIQRSLTQGFAKSTNFLAPTPWFREAVDMAKEHSLEVGVHLCLTCDWDRLKWGPLSPNPRLREADGSFPALHTGLEALGATDADMYEELKAQIQLVASSYGRPSHLDTHMAGGMYRGGIYDRLQRVITALAREFKLPYTYERRPDSNELVHFKAEACQSPLSRDEVFGILQGWDEPGTYHLFGHAAEDQPELWSMCSASHPARPWAGEWRVKDLAFYLDPRNLERIRDLGFELIRVSALGQA
jgi:predicted glycoside hydrolase/deacetylase ChbG (UPF0249 family)